MIDILQHETVPKHEILSKKEKEDILKRFDVSANNLPKILASEPVIKKIDAKLGDVIRITRKSETAGYAIYYRIVIKG